MVVALIALVAVVILAALSARANSFFKDEARLPMQWTLDGKVTSTAPRFIALALTPSVTALVLAFVVIANFFLQPRQGQGWMMVPAVFFIAVLAIAIHMIHLHLIRKRLNR